jgi:hypothetical protein
MIYIIGAMLLVLIIFVAVSYFLKQTWEKGRVTRGLNMALFSVKMPRDTAIKEGQEQKKEKEMLGVAEQLLSSFSSFHSTGWTKFLYGDPYISLEMAVHHVGEEIHFYVAVPKAFEQIIEKQILGLYPNAEVAQTKDYNIFASQGTSVGSYLMLFKHPVLPLRTYQKLEADPLGQILTALSKLQEEGEGAAIQILMRPAKSRKWKDLASKVSKEVQQGRSFYEALSRARKNEFFKDFSSIINGGKSEEAKKAEEKPRPVTPYHEDLVKGILAKSSQPVFDANIRIVASAPSEIRASQILEDIQSSFVQLTSPDLNALKPNKVTGRAFKRLIFDFSFRLFDEKNTVYLSTEELASIYHFPLPTTSASRVLSSKAKSAEPPADLPASGIILGKNTFRGQEKMIRMQAEDRRRHLYTIGQTGTGKSTFMKNLIEQDILNGEGVAVIDPHGELVDDILALIPKSRANDVIVFNPGDVSRPLGLNMLEIDPGQPQQKSFVIDDFFKILKMIYKDLPEAFGPIFEKFFKNTLMLLLDDYDHEIPTIAEISRVFADKEYRDDKLNRNTNPEIIRFWRYEAEKMSGEWSLPNMSGYITSKFAPFILNEYVRPIISQPKSAFNFRDVMDNRKILLVNLSKGLIGDLNANLLGMVIVSKLLVAALSRVDIENQEDRADFYLYIDEFQNFTTDSIATILSEARKYRLNLIMAHQFIKQLQENIRDAVFGNVGSMAVLRVGADDAEFLKNKFEPVFTPQDLMNIDNFNAYVNLLISNRTTRPFNVQFLRPKAGSPEIARAIKELSRLKYGRDRDEVEREFRQRQEASNFS